MPTPEPGAETDGLSGARVRRRGRPPSLVVAVLLFAAFWAVSAGMAGLGVAHDPRGRAGGVAGIAFWTAAFALVLWRVWRGGRTATVFLARIGMMLGIVFLLGTAAFTVLLFTAPPGGSTPKALAYLAPSLLAGLALLAGGVLLRREVSRWRRF
jgi:hypothetical protein